MIFFYAIVSFMVLGGGLVGGVLGGGRVGGMRVGVGLVGGLVLVAEGPPHYSLV